MLLVDGLAYPTPVLTLASIGERWGLTAAAVRAHLELDDDQPGDHDELSPRTAAVFDLVLASLNLARPGR